MSTQWAIGYLLAATTVDNDNVADKLTGSSGMDLFFAKQSEITDLHYNNEKKKETFFDY